MSNKKIIGNTIFLLAIFGLTVWGVFHGENLSQVFGYIVQMNKWYLIPSIICVVAFIFGESIVMWYMLKTIGVKVRIGRCYLYSFVGFFVSCITPSASGGQPAQIYYMKKDKIAVPVATLVLMIITITYKLVLVLIGVGILLFRPAGVMTLLQPVLFWCYLGIALNIFAVSSMFMLVFHPSLATRCMFTILRILEKLHLLKKKADRMERWNDHMEEYHAAAAYFSENKMVILNVVVITIIQRLILFFVTYLVCLAFGMTHYSWVVIMLGQAMISVAVDMLPLPGGMGVSETLFLAIFSPVFGQLTLPAMVVSRGISYYAQLLISAVMTVVAHFRIKGD